MEIRGDYIKSNKILPNPNKLLLPSFQIYLQDFLIWQIGTYWVFQLKRKRDVDVMVNILTIMNIYEKQTIKAFIINGTSSYDFGTGVVFLNICSTLSIIMLTLEKNYISFIKKTVQSLSWRHGFKVDEIYYFLGFFCQFFERKFQNICCEVKL